jgi:hypothetical protein
MRQLGMRRSIPPASAKLQQELAGAKETEKLYQPLLHKGYGSKLQLMQATDERSEMSRLSADAQNQMAALRKTLASPVPADFRLIPGMTRVGDIMVGKRMILAYLIEAAMRTGSEAMRKP